MIKVYHALPKREGLSVRIYESIDHAPAYCREYETMMRHGILEYHAPSANDFWAWLRTQPALSGWNTIITDKR